MKTTLFYYTGTGNSLWVSKELAKELGETDIVSMVDYVKDRKAIDTDAIGLIFPVYIWGAPGRVVNFANELKTMKTKYVFGIAVNAGQVSNTLIQLKTLLKNNNILLSAGFDVKTPSNYIPWGGPGPKDKVDNIIRTAKQRIKEISSYIRSTKQMPIEKGPLWHRVLFSFFYKMSFKHVHEMDKKFWVDDKCNKCSICEKVCPSKNITLADGKPVWNSKCEQCLACIQWCPKEAIQYGKKTPNYERYHHPEIKLKEVLKGPESSE